MANIYLGSSMSGSGLILLPRVRWINGSDPGIPTEYTKKVDKATMLDGSPRYNFRSKHPRHWSLVWEMLTTTEFAKMIALNEIDDALYFQNNWESSDWFTVVMGDFNYSPFLRAGSTVCRYNLSITLDEVS